MYERFTDRSRKVMALGEKAARRLNHESIGSEHILLGLIKEGSGVAANVLKNFDLTTKRIQAEVERLSPAGTSTPVTGRLPRNAHAEKVIDFAWEEARSLKHNYLGTEHLLMGAMRDQEGLAARVLLNLGVKPEDVRQEVLNLLGHGV